MGLGFFTPKTKILGADVSGKVESVGRNISQFKPGDEVYGDLADSGFGAFAEYVCARENVLSIKPANLTFEQAAAIPLAAVTALQGLRDTGKIQARQKVLINGASGGVGAFAIQIAKTFGAEVTAVCSSRNLELARSIGADHVIDYTKEDFTKNNQQYDLILAANGYHSLSDYKRSLSPRGIYVMSGGKPSQMFQSLILGPLMSKKIIFFLLRKRYPSPHNLTSSWNQ
jgi:NADPH:quinone reductase-like Zn-dependent oxidoreductase